MDGQDVNEYITINLYTVMILHNTYTKSAAYLKIKFTLKIYTYKYRIYKHSMFCYCKSESISIYILNMNSYMNWFTDRAYILLTA
jgi:hypothetical protein